MPCRGPDCYEAASFRESDKLSTLLMEIGNTARYASSDHKTDLLCTWCQSNDVSKQSLELQIWWRDHQEWDAQRIADELEEEEDDKARAIAMSKLTPYERDLLGI